MDDLIVKFCEYRRSWLFITAGTLLLGLVFIMPAVDEYSTLCNEKTETADQLALAEDSAKLVPGYEKHYSEQKTLADGQRDKTLHEGNEADFRNAVVKLVRESGCQLRRMNISEPQIRDWGHTDDPLQKTLARKVKPTGFKLEKRQVTLALAGPSTNVRRLIDNLETEEKQLHIQSLDLRPSTGDGSRVELTLELWCFTLVRRTA